MKPLPKPFASQLRRIGRQAPALSALVGKAAGDGDVRESVRVVGIMSLARAIRQVRGHPCGIDQIAPSTQITDDG